VNGLAILRRVLFSSLLLMAGLALQAEGVQAQTLIIADRHISRTYTSRQLLSDPATRTITLAHDAVYGRSMTFRALPTADLLKGLAIGSEDYVQARATDDFSIALPGRLLESATTNGAEAFVAIEDPAKPWPALPGSAAKKGSAGPYYLVWRAPPSAGISSEYWVYHLAGLAVTDSPAKRWPGLAVDASVPADSPIRRGLDRFVATCMACHRFKGNGEGTQGPDLGTPSNPVDYFQPGALEKLLRDPKSVRSWPDQKMPGFDRATLPDADIDAIVAWLAYKARQR
jgi:mono/diheme cytochrome c family protein